jgi:sugar phosphate isomerase/epimerase
MFNSAIARRSFLLSLPILGALPTLAASKRTTNGYLIGCYTRPWDQWDLDRALDGVAQAGFQWVGLMTAKGTPNTIIHPELSTAQAAQIGAKTKQRNLSICSVYGDFQPTPNLTASRQQLHQLIDLCAACGSPELLLGGTTNPEAYETFIKSIAAECPHAQASNLGITLKPHGGLNATGAQCRQAIQRVNHPSFRLWYDPANILYYSDGQLDPLKDVLDVDGLVVGMSIKDFLPPKNVLINPGSGQVNFTPLFARLRLGGFTRGQLLVECTAPGSFKEITEAATQARLLTERLARGQPFQGLKPEPQ